MKRVILTALFFTALTSQSFAGASIKQPKIFLFVQTAGSAEMQAVPNKSNTYELTLRKAAPYVTYFSERPYRVSGALEGEKFVQDWKKGHDNFYKSAPNAAIVGGLNSFIHQKYVNYGVELTDIRYDAKAQTFRYTVHVLKGEPAMPAKLKLHHVALFIDGFCLTCE